MQVDAEVLHVLSQARTAGKCLTMAQGLTRALYLRTNLVLESVGGKWSRKHKAHVFEQDADVAIASILHSGQTVIPQDFGYYPTPPDVVARMLELAELRPRHTVLEPSAGQAAIARQVCAFGANVDCVELLDGNIAVLRQLQAQGVLRGSILQADFLAITPTPNYDRIIMNPPFAKQADIHHVLHALQFLKPIGQLVAVMAAGVKFRENKLTNQLRNLIIDRGGSIEELPSGAFKASGTGVNTVIVTIPG